jgi:hypothetical protein
MRDKEKFSVRQSGLGSQEPDLPQTTLLRSKLMAIEDIVGCPRGYRYRHKVLTSHRSNDRPDYDPHLARGSFLYHPHQVDIFDVILQELGSQRQKAANYKRCC